MRLHGKVALITGGSAGIGKATAERFAVEGAKVVICDLDRDRGQSIIQTLGPEHRFYKVDVTDRNGVQEWVDDVVARFGRIDALVNNAGILADATLVKVKDGDLIKQMSEAAFDRVIAVNLKGVFLCNRAVAPLFRKQKRGKIINISSIGGRKGIDWIPHYSASKAAVIVFTQGVALQLAPFNVNVNTVCPGVIRTPMWDTGAKVLGQGYPPFKGMSPDDVFNAVVENMIPMKRPQTAEDIGKTVVFLASEDAKEITGQAINVDGGAILS